MSVRDVKNTFARAAADGKIDLKDVDQVMRAAGTVSVDEEKAIQAEADKFTGITDADAKAKLRERIGELGQLRKEAASINGKLERVAPKLQAEAQEKLTPGKATTSYGGSPIPEAVKKVVNDALAKGAVSYDVREMKGDPVYDTEHGEPELTLDGKFNPYAQEQRATDSMAFSHTEITPERIAKDMATEQTWREVDGYSGTGENQTAKFKTVTGKPSGDITSLYDEASWSETKARGPRGIKHASNFAILGDGSVHCVPASRRTSSESWRILTTASLGRGKHMLFNGHLEMKAGVVTYVGMSGRLCKMQEKGEAKFVDAVELLKAWGFKTAPGLKVTNEG